MWNLENGILNWGSFVHKTNVVGTLNMLGLAKRVGARFLLTSTSEVYGDPLQHPQKETYWGNVNPIGQFSLSLFYFLKFGMYVSVLDSHSHMLCTTDCYWFV